MTLAAFNPIRNFRAAYSLFIAAPLLICGEIIFLRWLAFRIAPNSQSFAYVSIYGGALLGQGLILAFAGLPTWNWFRQLRERHQKRLGFVITFIAIAHFLLLELWNALMTPAIRLWFQNSH